MTIVNHDDWELSERGEKDAERHRDKIDDAIRKNVKDVISEEAIITKKKGKKVKIPVRGLKDYRFVYGNDGDGPSAGVGQGEGEEGDVIGRQEKGEGEPGKPGNKDGEDYLETEVDIDYLIEIMFEDLGLPWIEEKTKKQHLVPKGWKFEAITKKGILPRVHKKKTMIEAIKRHVMFVNEIMSDTDCSEDDANHALMQANGDINEAIDIIKEGKLNGGERTGIVIEDDDLRFKQIEPDVELHSNAVVIAMMDTSGSMTTDKKYLARSMLFWLTEFLKKMYDNVDIKFIQHTTTANVVDEETFFHKGESGGTNCHTAFDKANYIIDTEYPINEWNVYCVYISDGDDFDHKKTLTSVQEMLDKKVNMLSYCEIRPEEYETQPWYSSGYKRLLDEITNNWKFEVHEEHGTRFYKSEAEHFLCSVIKSKEHIYPTLKHMLFQKT
jgi:uncharacterized protein